jgi:hypothetical protein
MLEVETGPVCGMTYTTFNLPSSINTHPVDADANSDFESGNNSE